MNLFLIVYERDESCDWFFVTFKKDYIQDDLKVKKLIAENYDIELNRFDDYINDYWVNRVSEVNGYKVNLVKE